MKHPATRMLFSYWDALRGERAAPERGEIEPGEIRHVLADAFVLELDEDRDARFRLAGTRMCALFGRELRDTRLVDLWPERARHDVRRNLDIVVDETAGIVSGIVGATGEGETVDLELLVLPLRHRGRPNARALGCLSARIVPTWIGFHSVTTLTTVSMRVVWPSGRPLDVVQPPLDAIERRRRFVVHDGGRAHG
ncbi:PAS domain-containing protein [Salinarimonas ramus]|uniref:PAS domain-containing protein n=1 Tax=Salinarimonas ramus TaxID=690164 RepID=A0A917V3M3_9HYPH|nr:PAS domain-containing protein [Salinarimonas ramus]GGK31370.1 PAS domain-containing protein [Salinarimonas ramus]